MSIEQLLNRENLIIARENAGFSTVQAKSKISQSESDLVYSWEMGDAVPTWKQLEKLGKIYGVPSLLFFSVKPIERIKKIADYRTLSKVEPVDDTDVKQLINLVVSRQNWIADKLSEGGHQRNTLMGSGARYETPQALAEFISKKLNFSTKDIKSVTGTTAEAKRKVLKCLIEKAEDKGVFIGKTLAQHKITVDQMRGLFIANDFCPYIVINRKDALSAQIFTLAHELAHFFRRTEGISNNIDFRDTGSNRNPEEVFCNQVAAELLLPISEFNKSFYTKEDISILASEYKLSRIFIFYRLKDLGRIRRFEVSELEREILAETKSGVSEKALKKASGGNYTNNMKDSNGSLFNRVIAGAYFDNHIGYVEASRLLRFSPERA